MKHLTIAAILTLVACTGRDQPHLYAVVSLPGEGADDCLPLREPALSSLPAGTVEKLRLPSDDYVWLVGETVEGPTGWAAALSSFSGGSALVSLTSGTGGRPSTRAVATIENGKVTHTYFGTPVTPAFANDDGTQLRLTFDARVLDAAALATAKAVLSAVPASGPAYGQIVAALVTPPEVKEEKPKGVSQTYVLADPRTCASGACQAVIADERLVLLSAGAKSAAELGKSVCLRQGRLYRNDGDEYDGAYAVLGVAHARLPEEALGDALSSRLSALARCDKDFGPELADRAVEGLADATLRATDREVVEGLVRATAFAARARTPEERLEAERRLAIAAKTTCERTPANGLVCARARHLSACATGRAGEALATAEAYRKALSTLDQLESAGSCEGRAQGLVALSRDLGALAAAAHEAHLEGTCVASAAGLSCEAFPELSKRSRIGVGDAQAALYGQCYCPAFAQDRTPNPVARLVREALRCEGMPEEFTLAPPAEAPLKDQDVADWQARRTTVVPALTVQQCPECVRLQRRMDDELARAVILGKNQAIVTGLLRDALAPVNELHERAFLLMSGDMGVRCSSRPDEWAVIAQALQFSIEPRDLFREGGQLDPSRLEAKLAKARLLMVSLDGLTCVRADEFAAPADLPRYSGGP